jgi:hypothetical protein
MTLFDTTPPPLPVTANNNRSPDTPALKCYCTALMARARFMSNGWRYVPCDGTACAFRRQESETADHHAAASG